MSLNEKKEIALSMKVDGKTYAEIAAQFGVTRQAVQLWFRPAIANRGACQRCGKVTILHRHHKSFVPEIIELLCASCHKKSEPKRLPKNNRVIVPYLKPNQTARELSRASGVDVETIRRYCKQLGYKFKKATGRLANVSNWKRPVREIAKECNVSSLSGVYEYIKRHKIIREDERGKWKRSH